MEQNYVVSARKYRPSTFESVVGQHAITHTLKTAIANQHLAQAYLFCGPRGVGKTSCARIFAKTINCEHPDANGDACNECESCRAFNEPADVVLPNGFENDFVPKGGQFTSVRRKARRRILDVATALTGDRLPDDTLIVSTSGRNDYRCKGFDVFLETMAQLKAQLAEADSSARVLALIEVPCWLKGPRADLQRTLAEGVKTVAAPLPNPIITHDLWNLDEDRIVRQMWQLGLNNLPTDKVKVILVPCYLEGTDGKSSRKIASSSARRIFNFFIIFFHLPLESSLMQVYRLLTY